MFRSQRVVQTGRRFISSSAVDNGRGASELSLVVKAGSRYEPSPGVAHLLQKFAFQDTKTRSGLRLQRESELLGGSLNSSLNQENLVLSARFLREDLPYFVEALADTVSNPLFREYQFNEDVVPLAKAEAAKKRADPLFVAREAAFEAAFHQGLANPLVVGSETTFKLDDVANFAKQAFGSGNVQLFGRNVSAEDLARFAGKDFASLYGQASLNAQKSTLHTGEFRVKQAGEQAAVLAFPTTQTKGLDALKRALTGHPIKWSTSFGVLNRVAVENGVGIHAHHGKFSDASLFYVTVKGPTAASVSAAVRATAQAVSDIAAGKLDEAVAKSAITSAKFHAAEREGTVKQILRPIEADASVADISAAAKNLVGGKRVLSVVGNTTALPYLSDLI